MTWNKVARWCSVVVAAAVLVHWAGQSVHSGPASAEPAADSAPRLAKTPAASDAPLPVNVAAMRDMIMSAVHSGRLDDLQAAIDQNELPPEFGAPEGTKPLDHLRKISADGDGREILATMGNLLEFSPARLPIGRDAENNGVYVWPAISEADLQKLSPAEEVVLYRLMPVAEAKALIAAKKWTWWRLAIGADGTWLTFMKHG